jgi:hypothetical protein
MNNRTPSERHAITGLRVLLGSLLLGTVWLVAGCMSTPVQTTTVERTTSQQNVVMPAPGTTVTTRTQQSTP